MVERPDVDVPTVAVIGAGPAGLSTAYELIKNNAPHRPIVFESNSIVGGISRTETHQGFRFDIGGHRFFTKVPEIERMWHDVLGDDFITVSRKSRIFFRGRFFDYPLKLFNVLSNIGAYESLRIWLSYLKWQVRPHEREDSFEQWVMNRFGGRLYDHFFRSYTKKVWGIPPRQIQADWAAQRIKNLSLSKAVWNAISGANDTASLIERFKYPRLGPGMMWERVADLVNKAGGQVRMDSWVEGIHRNGTTVTAIDVAQSTGDGKTRRYSIEADHFVNSMALRDLVERFDPPPPPEVQAAAAGLKYRDFVIVTLVLDKPDPFPDNWIYVHNPSVKVGRIQNFRAWSREMVPNERQSSIGMEYFCALGDEFWRKGDDELIELAGRELAQLGLGEASDVVGGTVIRQPKAYPVYDTVYRESLETISAWIRTLDNFQTVGRNGLHRYNNQDHSMLTGILAARNIMGEDNDVWEVNVERSYHETFERERVPSEHGLKTAA